METPAIQRPRLKRDTVFLPMDDGVFVQSDGAACMLKGKSAYRWLATLSPYLNGAHSLDELCANLAPPQRDTVARLIETLFQRGVLTDYSPDATRLAPVVQARFAEQIAFIDHFADRPQGRFAGFRTSRVLLAGGGPAYLALASTLLRNGLEQIAIAAADPEPYLRALEPLADELRANEIAADVFAVGGPEQQELSRYDLVVYCADESALHQVSALNARCVRAGVPFLPAVVVGEQALIGPLTGPQGGPCWSCATLRLAANRPEDAAALWQRIALPDAFVGPAACGGDPTAVMIGNSLAFEVFKIRAGHLPSESEQAVVVQHLVTLTSRRARLSPHPCCPVCAGKTHGAAVALTPAADSAACYERLEPLVDEQFGPFRAFVDDDRTQLPLKSAALLMADPGAAASAPVVISAYSLTNLFEARVAAFRAAIGRYSARLVSPARICWASRAHLTQRGYEALAPEALSTWSGTDPAEQTLPWVAARSLRDGRTVYLPAGAVYPNTSLNRGLLFEPTTAGLGVGRTPAEAQEQARQSLAAYDALRAMLAGAVAPRAIDPATLGDDPDLRFLLNSLGPFEATVTLAELCRDATVLILASAAGATGRITASGVAATTQSALIDALTTLIGRLQTSQIDQLAPAEDELLPSLIAWEPLIAGSSAAHQPAPAAGAHAEARELFLIDLTTDDISATATFTCLRVVAARPIAR